MRRRVVRNIENDNKPKTEFEKLPTELQDIINNSKNAKIPSTMPNTIKILKKGKSSVVTENINDVPLDASLNIVENNESKEVIFDMIPKIKILNEETNETELKNLQLEFNKFDLLEDVYNVLNKQKTDIDNQLFDLESRLNNHMNDKRLVDRVTDINDDLINKFTSLQKDFIDFKDSYNESLFKINSKLSNVLSSLKNLEEKTEEKFLNVYQDMHSNKNNILNKSEDD